MYLKSDDYKKRGDAHFLKGDINAAWEDYNQAIKLVTSSVESYKLQGDIYKTLGQLNEAITAYNQAIMLKPEFSEAFQSLLDIYRIQGRSLFEIIQLRYRIADSISEASGLCERARVRYILKNYNSAIQLLSAAITSDPHYIEAYLKLGNVYLECNMLNEATSNFDKAKALDPEHAEVYIGFGLIYQRQGKKVEAILNYLKILELNPSNKIVSNYLAKHTKKNILLAIKYLPKEQEIKMLIQIMNKETPLGQRFWKREGFFKCRMEKGNLKIAKDRYDLLTKDRVEVRKSARMVAQGMRDQHSAFSLFPPEIGIKIAKFTASSELASKEARYIATENLDRPKSCVM